MLLYIAAAIIVHIITALHRKASKRCAMKRRLHLPSAHRHGRSPSIHRSCSKRERAESLWSLSHRVSSFPFVSTGLRDRNLYAPFVPPRCRFNEGTGSGISAPRSTTLHLPRSSERDQVFLHDKHNFSLSLSFFFLLFLFRTFPNFGIVCLFFCLFFSFFENGRVFCVVLICRTNIIVLALQSLRLSFLAWKFKRFCLSILFSL